MSNVESYVGKLVPVELDGLTVDEWIQNKVGKTELGYFQNWVEVLYEEFWKEYHFDNSSGILYEIVKEPFDSENFVRMSKNDDGSYDFVVSFYNGGAFLNEVLQEGVSQTD